MLSSNSVISAVNQLGFDRSVNVGLYVLYVGVVLDDSVGRARPAWV